MFTTLGLSEDLAKLVAPYFTRTEIPKGGYFVKQGQLSQALAYVETGNFLYVAEKDGDEITTYAVGKGGFIASLASYFRLVPAQESIKAICNTVIYVLQRDDQIRLQAENEEFRSWVLALLEYQIVCIDESRLSHLTLSAEERYQQLLEKDRDLIQTIPQKYLASLLGITPRHLTRIRGYKH